MDMHTMWFLPYLPFILFCALTAWRTLVVPSFRTGRLPLQTPSADAAFRPVLSALPRISLSVITCQRRRYCATGDDLPPSGIPFVRTQFGCSN